MQQKAESKPYLLGLDLGVQSIGWVVCDLDDSSRACGIRRAGVRCFDSGVGSEREIELGKDESANTKRRQARQQRRQSARRAQRLRRVFHVLQRIGLLSRNPVGAQARHEFFKALDCRLAEEYGIEADRIDGHLLPYRLRARALDTVLPPYALGRALYHLAQRRGFLSNKKTKKDSDEEGQVKAGISQLYAEMEAAQARTLGEYLGGLDPEAQRIRGRWTSRHMYLDEFEKIWCAQASHHAALNAEAKKRLHHAIFFQRPLKSQRGLIGKCDLEPGRRRAPMACLDAQRFRFLQKINDLEIIAPDGQILALTDAQRCTLAAALEGSEAIKFRGISNLLGFRKPKGGTAGYSFNLEAGGETKIPGNRTAARLAEVLGDRWLQMDDSERDRLVNELLAFEKEEPLARRLEKAWRFDSATASALAATELEPGYCALSRKAIAKLLPSLRAGVRLNEARAQLYGNRREEAKVHESLPPVLHAVPALRNPVVCRALTEVRKVVNSLIREYGKPACVRIELARDMKKSRAARKQASDDMRQREKLRTDAKKKILAELGISEPSPGDIVKVLLAEECNWQCPYTGRSITPTSLLGKSPQFDVEHILPFSRSLDNSFLNKTLCYHEENRKVKQNRTPYEAYGSSPDRWNEILQRVRRFRGSGAESKLRKFQMQKIPSDFSARQLNDTRFISRLAADYVGLLFGGRCDPDGRLRVQVSTGGATAFLRDEWGLNTILSDGRSKERTDHRHHAVDAVAIALTDTVTIRLLSRSAEQAAQIGRRLFVPIDPPWAGTAKAFVNEVRQAIDAICVSYRVDRHVAGRLHKDSFYSPPCSAPKENGRIAAYRHIRKPLEDMSRDEVDAIVDGAIRNCVKAKLEQVGGDPKQAFADVANHPYLRTADGRIIPIHKARIRTNVTTFAVGRPPHERHVCPGQNHHIAIYEVVDGRGRRKWDAGKPVSMFEASRRAAKREGYPVVDRVSTEQRRFVFSLANNECVEMEHEPGVRAVYRVVGITEGEIEFHLHTDARPTKVKGRKRVRRSPSSLLKANARKVTVDPLGNVLPAHD